MWTQHRIGTEKLQFLIREKHNMETEEDILALYINLNNMVHVFTNPQMDFIFLVGNYCKKKILYKIFAFADKVVSWKVVVREHSPNLFLQIHTYIIYVD